jgi:hypothetical protein
MANIIPQYVNSIRRKLLLSIYSFPIQVKCRLCTISHSLPFKFILPSYNPTMATLTIFMAGKPPIL